MSIYVTLSNKRKIKSRYPFGMVIEDRQYMSPDYRYGFQGQEKDDEMKGDGNSYTAEYWQYDPRLGRRSNMDPKPNPSISHYAVFVNNPIFYIDLQGDTVYRFNTSGEFLEMAELDVEGIRGSMGCFVSNVNEDGSSTQVWNSERDFEFNDPSIDRGQLNFLVVGDKFLQVISDGNINDMMKRSGIEPKNIYSRMRYAQKESSGGKMDFALLYLDGHVSNKNNNRVGGFYLYDNNMAYNTQDAGNFLWGNAMNRLGFDFSTAKFGSELNEWFGDSPADQRAIRSGFHYKVSTDEAIYFENNNGIRNKQ